MDELYAFLFAGLFILLMLYIFFGGTKTTYPINETNISGKVNLKTIELGNIAFKEQKLEKKEILGDFRVSNGVFFGKSSYKRRFEIEDYILKTLENSTLSFNVKDTNNYGELYIILNNETIFKNRALLGNYKLNISPRKENVIEFETSSSGWKIWAPSVYDISNLSIEMDYSFKEIPRYTFFVPEYIYKNLNKCELLFDFISADEEFNITLNNQTEYSGIPEFPVKVVPLENIKEGKNLISFSSNGEVKLKNARIRLFYYE